jgi:hypothetical protein
MPRQTLGSNKPTIYSLGTRRAFTGSKWPESEADHSSSSNTEVKNVLCYRSTCTLLYAFLEQMSSNSSLVV